MSVLTSLLERVHRKLLRRLYEQEDNTSPEEYEDIIDKFELSLPYASTNTTAPEEREI